MTTCIINQLNKFIIWFFRDSLQTHSTQIEESLEFYALLASQVDVSKQKENLIKHMERAPEDKDILIQVLLHQISDLNVELRSLKPNCQSMQTMPNSPKHFILIQEIALMPNTLAIISMKMDQHHQNFKSLMRLWGNAKPKRLIPCSGKWCKDKIINNNITYLTVFLVLKEDVICTKFENIKRGRGALPTNLICLNLIL